MFKTFKKKNNQLINLKMIKLESLVLFNDLLTEIFLFRDSTNRNVENIAQIFHEIFSKYPGIEERQNSKFYSTIMGDIVFIDRINSRKAAPGTMINAKENLLVNIAKEISNIIDPGCFKGMNDQQILRELLNTGTLKKILI